MKLNNLRNDFLVFSYASIYWLCNYIFIIKKILRILNKAKIKRKINNQYNPVNKRRKENLDIIENYVNQNQSKEEINLLEIGAGKTLIDPIKRSNIKKINQYVLDIENQLSYEEIIKNIKKFRKDKDTSNLTKTNLINFLKELKIFYLVSKNLDDLYPMLPKINIFYSINTFEHIPPTDIKNIFKKFKYLSAKNSISLHLVDFSDHYSSIPGISEWNFYRYKRLIWNYLNPPYFYQNRLRHKDYLTIFNSYGLKIDQDLTKKFYSQKKINIKSLNKKIIEVYSYKDLKNTATRFILTNS